VKRNLDLSLLEQFLVVARTGNMTRASEELHLSQSALSRSVQRLEDQLGQVLFLRQPREMVLTETGELLVGRAREILKLVEETCLEVAEAGHRGRVRLGAIPTIAPYFLPRVLASFAEARPDVAVTVQEDTTDQLVRRCVHGEVDLVLVALPIGAKGLEVEPLFTEELYLVVPPGHPLAGVQEVTAGVVGEYPFVMLNEAHCLSESIASFCRRQSVQPVAVERTSQLTTVQELVALDHGVSMVPAMAREVDQTERRIYRSFSGERPSRTVAVMWHAGRFQGRAARQLLEHLRHAVSAGGWGGARIP
jgi:LysR family hydrogen peroxide-inducible transcriptional activator